MFDYEREIDHIYVNGDDPDLGGKHGQHAIRVDLPTVESFFELPWEEGIKLIDGYGVEPKKQKFDYYRDTLKSFVLPERLQGLIERLTIELSDKNKKPVTPTVEQIFDRIEENPAEYRDEIDWIKVQKKRAVQGYWCFIKGRPTYIDGWHYTYLTNNPIKNLKGARKKDRLPAYRDIDRRQCLFMKWAYTTTEAPFRYKLIGRMNGEIKEAYFNDKKRALRYANLKMSYFEIEEGDFIHNTGQRTVMGVVWATRRRRGKTYWMGHIGLRIAMDRPAGTFAIQALTETTAVDDVYAEKVKAPFESMFFFHKPSNQVFTDGISFTPKKAAALNASLQQHAGRVMVRSSENKAFDGNEIHAYGNDESGKKTSGDIRAEYDDTISNTLKQGTTIHGFAMYFSTFGDFEKGGGKQFFELCKASINHKRNDIGRTATGMVSYFESSLDGHDDCVDEYGYSIIEDPDEPYINTSGVKMTLGSRSIMDAELEYLKGEGDQVSVNAYVRNNPRTLREAARRAIRSDNFDLNTINSRIEYLEFDENAPKPRSVNLEWVGGKRFVHKEVGDKLVNTGQLSDVIITEPPLGTQGKFNIYYQPPDDRKNKKSFNPYNSQWGPDTNFKHRYVVGCDPFAYDLVDTVGKGKNLSKGGGIVHWKRDMNIDGDDFDVQNWQSNTTAMTYNVRAATTDEYVDDMLKAAVLYSCMVCTERNVTHVIKKLREWGCNDYLLHITNPITGELDPLPGVRTQGDAKQTLFTMVRDYAKNHGHRECSLEILNQIAETETLEDLTDNDLFASLGVALMGSESRQIVEADERSYVVDMSNEATYD